MIRLAYPSIEEEDIQAVREVLETGYLIQGKKVAELEESVANYTGASYAVAVNNCTSALYLSLLALDVDASDLVLVPTYSWPATANVVECCKAHPVFIEIEPDTFNMNPNCLEDKLRALMSISSISKRVKAIIPVHTFGQMANMREIIGIAQRYDIPVIEDAACALGARWENNPAGTWGVMGCFSFHPRKAITTGEGGMIVTNDILLVNKLRALRNHGLSAESTYPDFIMPGYNMRMTEFQAALGITQMQKLNRIIKKRQELAMVYNTLLKGSSLKPPYVKEQSFHVYQSYVALLPKGSTENRMNLIEKMKAKGIETNIGTWHIPLTTYYRTRYGYTKGDFSVTDDVFSRSLCLPMFESIKKEEQEMVISTLIKVVEE